MKRVYCGVEGYLGLEMFGFLGLGAFGFVVRAFAVDVLVGGHLGGFMGLVEGVFGGVLGVYRGASFILLVNKWFTHIIIWI